MKVHAAVIRLRSGEDRGDCWELQPSRNEVEPILCRDVVAELAV